MSHLSENHPVVNGLISQVPDNDPAETAEWIESLSGLIDEKGGPRARYILLHMLDQARHQGVHVPQEYTTPYVNTIPVHEEPYFPGDEAMERQYRRWIRWPGHQGRWTHLLLRLGFNALRGWPQPLLPR